MKNLKIKIGGGGILPCNYKKKLQDMLSQMQKLFLI